MKTFVEVENLSKTFGTTPVVRGVSLTVPQGTFLALLGPSGCGKTTTLRMIAGLETPDAGRILIDGHVVNEGAGHHVPPEQRGLSMVFQSYAVWPHKSVGENVEYPLRLQRLGQHERDLRVQEALGWVRLSGFEARMPHELSGGQLQRVALARALVARPKVLLLDEPLSNLDALLREELRHEIATLRARLGTTMIYVTHDQAEALALADSIAVMNKGEVEQFAPPDVVYNDPASEFVAHFVGGANVIEGVVQGRGFAVGEVVFTLPPDALGEPGPASLVVRPEDVLIDPVGTRLPLAVKAFMGATTEFRFTVGATQLRAIAPHHPAAVGDKLGVSFKKAKLFSKRLR